MARRLAAAISIAGAIVLPGSQALRLSQQGDSGDISSQQGEGDSGDLSCLCLNWDAVYKQHGVTCGQGMELFFALDDRKADMDTNARHKVVLAKSSANATAMLEELKALPIYSEFCSNFFMKAHFSYCVAKRYLMKEAQKKTSKGTWCYVSNKCKLPTVTPIPGTDLGAKHCSSAVDVSLGNMLVEDETKLGKQQGLDLGIIAGHSFIHLDMPVSNVTEAQVQDIMHSGEGTYIWSARDFSGPRWIVRGKTIFEQRPDYNVSGRFDVTCIRGCAW